MALRNIKKNLAGMEDLLLGVGQEEQVRGESTYQITKVDMPVAVSSAAELEALDTTQFQYATIVQEGVAAPMRWNVALAKWKDATKFSSVAALKLASLQSGQRVSTRSYYAQDIAQGGAEYDILTLQEVRDAKGNPAWVPDGYGDHYLANGNVAVGVDLMYASQYGVSPNISDSAPCFRAFIKTGKTVYIDSDCIFDSSLGAVPGVASSPSVAIDGVSGSKLIGVISQSGGKPKITMGAAQSLSNNNFFTYYVSSASEAAGSYSKDNQLKNVELVFNRAASLVGNVSGVNATSCEGFELENVTFNANGNENCLGVPGTGGLNNKFMNNEFIGIATCFDNSQMQDCTYQGNVCVGDSNAVTAFNHFYDTNTLANVRMSRALSLPIASGCLYDSNEVSGYGAAFSIRGMAAFTVSNNHIHSFSANDATTRNAISIYTESAADAIGQPTRLASIKGNKIHGTDNAGAGTHRAIFANRTLPVGVVSYMDNFIFDMPNSTGISFDGDSSEDICINNIIDSATVGTPYGRDVIEIHPGGGTGLSPEISSLSTDIILRPASGRYVRFGTVTPVGAETVSSYIEVRDLAGVVRKLAVIS